MTFPIRCKLKRARLEIWIAAGCALLLMSGQASASGSQLWTGGAATVKLSDKWALSQDLTARFSDDKHGLYEVELNTLLGYRLSKNVALWAGYTHDPNYSGGHFRIMEHRFREQVTIDNFADLGGGKLSGRVRLEQRWRDGLNGTGWRVRPFLRYTLPLRPGGKTALTISEEPFIDFNQTAFQKVKGLDRLRTFVGIATPLGKHVKCEFGYLNQYGFVPGRKNTVDNVASATLSLSF